jgi:hypothetical protein
VIPEQAEHEPTPRERAVALISTATKTFEESEPNYGEGEHFALEAAHLWSRVYVGDQIGRLITLLEGGAEITTAGDYHGDETRYVSLNQTGGV